MNKLKKYDNEIRRLKMKSTENDKNNILCYICLQKIIKKIKRTGNITQKNNKSKYSKINEALKMLKICSFVTNEILNDFCFDLKYTFDIPIKQDIPENFEDSISFFKCLNTNIYAVTNNINESIKSYYHREFHEAELFYTLGYYNEALLRFQNLLNELEQRDDEAYMKEYVSEENRADYIYTRDKLKNNIIEIIHEIEGKIE
jgi:hypothetical protein